MLQPHYRQREVSSDLKPRIRLIVEVEGRNVKILEIIHYEIQSIAITKRIKPQPGMCKCISCKKLCRRMQSQVDGHIHAPLLKHNLNLSVAAYNTHS